MFRFGPWFSIVADLVRGQSQARQFDLQCLENSGHVVFRRQGQAPCVHVCFEWTVLVQIQKIDAHVFETSCHHATGVIKHAGQILAGNTHHEIPAAPLETRLPRQFQGFQGHPAIMDAAQPPQQFIIQSLHAQADAIPSERLGSLQPGEIHRPGIGFQCGFRQRREIERFVGGICQCAQFVQAHQRWCAASEIQGVHLRVFQRVAPAPHLRDKSGYGGGLK